jgi:serine/threonine protein kinase
VIAAWLLCGQEWEGVSTQAVGLVKQLLCKEPTERCTAAGLVSHPWVRGEDVPAQPLPATHERLSAFIQARRRAGPPHLPAVTLAVAYWRSLLAVTC